MKIRYLHVFLFVFCLSLTQVSLKAQEATVRGFLYEEESGEPAIFANVVLKGTNFGASTDVNGYFLISKIPPGDYTLMVTYLGFDTISELISLSKGALLNKKLFVKKGHSIWRR